MHLLVSEHLLSCECLILAVLDSRRLLEVSAHLVVSDDAFLLHHSLEALNRFLEGFSLINFYECHI